MDIDFLQLSLGFIIGVIGTLIWHFFRQKTDSSNASTNLSEIHTIEISKSTLEGELKAIKEQLHLITKERDNLVLKLQELISENGKLFASNQSLSSQITESQKVQDTFKKEFELIANRVLEKNTQSFNENSHRSLKGLLDPLQEKMLDFKKEINDKYINEAKDKASLKTEISKLVEMSSKLSTEASQLTHALKGDNKQHGNWGEVILEKVLERSGLEKGAEFYTQKHIKTTDGSTQIPDAVIFLPDHKHIIVDSKVSLVAYERLINATDKEVQKTQLQLHLSSLKSHIKELSEKKYFDSPQFNSPEFTLLFIPIEASFSIALREDTELFHYGWDRNVIIVSPTTLLATLQTVASIWKHEKQTRHVLEIAKEGGALHDKFVAFVDEMQKIEKNLSATQNTFDKAFNKLSTGKGNLINRTNKLKILGAKAHKALSSEIINQAQNSDFEN